MSARKVRGGCERNVGQSSNNGECGVTASKIEHALACVVGEGIRVGGGWAARFCPCHARASRDAMAGNRPAVWGV